MWHRSMVKIKIGGGSAIDNIDPLMNLPTFLALGKLYTFDPNVFQPSEPEQREIANLILAISVAANDMKDLLMGWEANELARPPESSKRSAPLGQYAGLRRHIEKLFIGTMREFLKLLREHRPLFEQPYFKKLHKNMSLEAQGKWDKLMAFATMEKTTPVHDVMNDVRHKISFHYDPDLLAKAYVNRFGIENLAKDNYPFVSCGEILMEFRYFFADALIETGLNPKGQINADAFWKAIKETSDQLAATSLALLMAFFSDRGAKLNEYSEV
jgi:hypothetical protein